MTGARYILAGGGTGGHLFPGLAVADALRSLQPDAQVTFLTTGRPLDRELLGRTPFEQIQQDVRPFSLRPLRWPGFAWHWHRSLRAARGLLKRSGARAVLGLGGYAAGPAVAAARALHIRTAILNPDAIPGRANRWLARRCDLVVLQWSPSRRYLPGKVNCLTLGCPIRRAFLGADRAAGCRRFALDPARPVLLVTGASQGARTINRAMQRVWPAFAARHAAWQLLHLSGPADEPETRAAYRQLRSAARVQAFTHEMALAMAAADVVVARAGASTLAELSALGKPAVLLPYPYHRDRHQHANAQVFAAARAAVLLEDRLDPAANAGPLLEALEALTQPAVRQSMSHAARRLARPQAADDVARWLIG